MEREGERAKEWDFLGKLKYNSLRIRRMGTERNVTKIYKNTYI